MADAEPLRFYEVTLTEEQWSWVRERIEYAAAMKKEARVKHDACEAFRNARITDLPPFKVDWAAMEREAEERNSSLMDLLYDRAHRREDEAA